jgi:pimeloyl-ACP methyl ester carboxylesterase
MASFGLKVIRGMFAAGERVAPDLTGRLAFELFCRTANPQKLTERENRAVERAADFMSGAQHHHLRLKTGSVTANEFNPKAGRVLLGTVLVIHGWRSRTEYMRALIVGFSESGYRVVSLDLPGHGQSPGRRLTLMTAVEAAHAAGEQFGSFAAVVGHSFGGAVAVNAVAGSLQGIPPLAAQHLVLIAAPSSLPAIFADFSAMVGVGSRAQRAMAERVERLAGRPLADFSGVRQLTDMPLPTLVIHARDDQEVLAEHATRYAQAGDHVAVHWVDGLGHRRILSDPGVVNRAVAFVGNEQQPALLH